MLPSQIRRSLGGFRRCGEDRFLVFLHYRQPIGKILRVIGAGLVGYLKIGTEERGAQFGDKLLYRIGLIAEAFSQLPVATGLSRSPMRQFMAESRIIRFRRRAGRRSDEGCTRGNLYAVRRRPVKGAGSAMVNLSAGRGNEGLGLLDRRHEDDRCVDLR